jgi:hypothetical protein
MAQTLKFGNKTWATKKGSTLAYNDENGNYKPLPFAFTRSTSATRVNKEGLIEVVTNDRPRIDYTDTSDGVLLLEKAATNLLSYSEDFSQSYWIKGNSSIVSNNAISPDGSLNASKLVEGTNNGTHYLEKPLGSADGSTNTVSLFAKKAERNHITIYCGGNSSDSSTFNLKNGTSVDNGTSTSKIELISNGWYRCSVTSINKNKYIYIMPNNGESDVYTGDGSSGIYVYGAQFETGNVASSYIPTQGSATTRVAETANNAGNSEVFNDSEGVLFADVISNGGTTDGYISISDLTTNNRLAIRIGYNNSNKVSLFMVSNGGSAEFEEFYDVGSLGFRNFNKFALKYKVNDVSLFFNGFEVITISSAAMASGFKSLNFANATGGTQPFYGKTKEIGYYDTILTDLELETLTSYRSWESMVNELNLNIIYNG